MGQAKHAHNMAQAERIGILSGTFNPFHMGHLYIAEALYAGFCDHVMLVPCGDAPHKEIAAGASALQRLAMIRAACEALPHMSVSPIELYRDGPSYSVDTLRALQADYPQSALYFAIGMDQCRVLHTWKDYIALCDLATLVVFPRDGETLNEDYRARYLVPLLPRMVFVDTSPPPIASTNIRVRLQQGKSIADYVPPTVSAFIRKHGLYQK